MLRRNYYFYRLNPAMVVKLYHPCTQFIRNDRRIVTFSVHLITTFTYLLTYL